MPPIEVGGAVLDPAAGGGVVVPHRDRRRRGGLLAGATSMRSSAVTPEARRTGALLSAFIRLTSSDAEADEGHRRAVVAHALELAGERRIESVHLRLHRGHLDVHITGVGRAVLVHEGVGREGHLADARVDAAAGRPVDDLVTASTGPTSGR